MIRFFFGVALGVYLTQNYNVPDLLDIVKLVRSTLEAYEKDPLSKRK